GLYFTFAPPVVLVEIFVGQDAEDRPQITPLPGNLGKNFEIMLQLGWTLPLVVSMKVKSAGVVNIAQGVIHVVEQQLKVFATFVGQHDFHSRLERHRDITVKAFTLRAGEQCRLKHRHSPESEAKEVAERS